MCLETTGFVNDGFNCLCTINCGCRCDQKFTFAMLELLVGIRSSNEADEAVVSLISPALIKPEFISLKKTSENIVLLT